MRRFPSCLPTLPSFSPEVHCFVINVGHFLCNSSLSKSSVGQISPLGSYQGLCKLHYKNNVGTQIIISGIQLSSRVTGFEIKTWGSSSNSAAHSLSERIYSDENGSSHIFIRIP